MDQGDTNNGAVSHVGGKVGGTPLKPDTQGLYSTKIKRKPGGVGGVKSGRG